MHLSSKPAKNWIYRQERVDFVAGDTDFKKCRRVQTSVFTLMFMSGNFKREKRVEEKEAKKKKDPWVPITNNSDKHLYKNAGFLFFFIPFTIKTFQRPLCVAMRSVRFYQCVRCTIICGEFWDTDMYIFTFLFVKWHRFRPMTLKCTLGDIGCKMILISRNIGR